MLVAVMVHESSELPSSSLVVMLYEYELSSVAAVTAVLDTLGESLRFATALVAELVELSAVPWPSV
jgi:hypothetical protein|tara:strand:+ start:778 stop:975 length:198 start_codon:yes stop_codon:yes gene_type:complete